MKGKKFTLVVQCHCGCGEIAVRHILAKTVMDAHEQAIGGAQAEDREVSVVAAFRGWLLSAFST
jgi:hypothetical protein